MDVWELRQSLLLGNDEFIYQWNEILCHKNFSGILLKPFLGSTHPSSLSYLNSKKEPH